jgi:hypothetical protein
MDAGPEFAYMNDAIAVAPGYIAAGQADSAAAAVWSTTDGEHWTLEWEHPTENSAIYALDVVPGGYAAVGKLGRDVDDFNLDAVAVWMSDDARHWRLVSTDLRIFGPTGTASLDEATNWRGNTVASGDFGLVVGGHSFGITGADVGQAAIWHSADGGESWVRAEPEPGIFDRAAINDLTVTPDTLVAVGRSSGTAAMWASADGLKGAGGSRRFRVRERLEPA